MSIKTWKKEFYPLPASRCPKERAARHSLQKWLGLRKKELKKHGLEQYRDSIRDKDGICFYMDHLTCALCKHYGSSITCKNCPLAKLRGGLRCDKPSDNSPYGKWYDDYDYGGTDSNIRPMLNLLRKAAKLEEKQYGP